MNRKRFSRTTADQQAGRKPGHPLLRAVLVILIFGVLVSVFLFIGTRNDFFTRLWVYWQKPNASLDGYFEYLGFGARQIYGDTALNTFYSYPWMGVGPGNYALYFAEMLPYEPLARTPEVLRVITPEAGRDRLITAKNFFLRLLAETGIIGTAAFIGFFVTIIGSMLSLIRSPDKSDRKYLSAKTWGVGSLLALVAFTFSTLSFDSFALPNMWVAFGFITAAYKVYVIQST
jgi:O-antigen ligase